MKISLKLLESDSTIAEAILKSIKDHMSMVMQKAQKDIISNIQNIVRTSIVSEPEYQSLLSGQLKYEFGIPNSNIAVDQILDRWINNINIHNLPIKSSRQGVVGGFSIDMIKDDYSDVLSLPLARVIDSNSGFEIPWLQWLLLEGGKVLVKNYSVKMGPNPASRTGMAVMIESDSNWIVPPQFAGTSQNNWVYRAISRINNEIETMIQNILEKYI